jgi:hypothetical protein
MGPRILYVVRRGPPSVDTHVLSGLLVAPGAAEQAVLCFLDSAPPEVPDEIRVAELPATVVGRRGAPAAVVRAVGDVAAGLGVQLIHGIGAEAQLVAGPAARKARVASIWSQLGLGSWRDLRQLRAALTPAGAVLTYTGAGLAAQRRLPRGSRAQPVPLGVFMPEEPRRERCRRARSTLGIPQDAFVAARAGPVTQADASLAVFLEAGRTLCHARPMAHLLLPPAPRGHERAVIQAIETSAGALRAAERIHETGAADNDLAIYDAADVVAYDAAPDALPLGVLHAMAGGAAVVTADLPLVREWAEDRAEAVFVPPSDSETLALALLALADDPDQRETLALAGEARVRERADAGAMAAAAAAASEGVIR